MADRDLQPPSLTPRAGVKTGHQLGPMEAQLAIMVALNHRKALPQLIIKTTRIALPMLVLIEVEA